MLYDNSILINQSLVLILFVSAARRRYFLKRRRRDQNRRRRRRNGVKSRDFTDSISPNIIKCRGQFQIILRHLISMSYPVVIDRGQDLRPRRVRVILP